MTKRLKFALSILLPAFCIKAQPTLWDVQSADTVEPGKYFFQVQSNVTEEQIVNGAVITRGFDEGIEVGLTIHQLTHEFGRNASFMEASPANPEETADVLLNVQKIFRISNWYSVGIGSRSGVNIPRVTSLLKYAGFTFLNNRVSIPGSEHQFALGAYYANEQYAGDGNNFGLMAGMQLEVIKEKMAFVTDFISGSNALAVINSGFNFSFGEHLQLGVALQLPVPGSNNDTSGIFQLTIK
jgi:hypothetical protein